MAPERRVMLHDLLVKVLGSRNVYFQPPEGLKIEYPAIIYGFDNTRVEYGNNLPYAVKRRYQITYIDRDPDSDILDVLLRMPMTRLASTYIAKGLNHYNFSTYF